LFHFLVVRGLLLFGAFAGVLLLGLFAVRRAGGFLLFLLKILFRFHCGLLCRGGLLRRLQGGGLLRGGDGLLPGQDGVLLRDSLLLGCGVLAGQIGDGGGVDIPVGSHTAESVGIIGASPSIGPDAHPALLGGGRLF